MYIRWGKQAGMWETHGFRGKMVCWSRICGVSTSTDPSQSEPSLVNGHIPISGEKEESPLLVILLVISPVLFGERTVMTY